MTERTVPKEFNDANIAAARRFKAERDTLMKALKEIAEAYVDAPGGASPEPTTELVWKMYSTARDAIALVGGAQGD